MLKSRRLHIQAPINTLIIHILFSISAYIVPRDITLAEHSLHLQTNIIPTRNILW